MLSSSSFLVSLWNPQQQYEMDIVYQMTMILGTSIVGLMGLIALQQPKSTSIVTINNNTTTTTGINNTTATSTATGEVITTIIPSSFLPNPMMEPSKYAYEVYVAMYTPIWILLFGCIVITQYYEQLTPIGYILLCTILALPFVLQPILLPGGIIPIMMMYYSTGSSSSSHNNHNTTTKPNHSSTVSPDQYRPLLERYCFKANVWIATYSFIGNYWYTHYFYSVLQASYTMPHAIRLNNVPIQMYCATHFYFTTYHWFSNCLLRKICTTYQPTLIRHVLFVAVIIVFSYFTAFMETLTISSYPYYTFHDRHMAYTVGSAFYGIYFLVSFPAFYYFDPHVDRAIVSLVSSSSSKNNDAPISNHHTHDYYYGKPLSIGETIVQACGYGMIILFLLDFVRLWLNIPLIVGG